MNGLGGNTCIQDAFNLAWKLAAVLRWGAAETLLESYGQERQPIGRHVVDRAIAGWRQNPEVVRALGIDPQAAPAERMAQFEVLFEDSDAGEQRRADFEAAKSSKVWSYHAHGTEMNQVYASNAVIGDGTPLPEIDDLTYRPTSMPGARVPHVWVRHGGRTVSTLDLCGAERFTLLTGVRGRAWADAAARLADELGVPLAAFTVGPGGDVADLYGQWGAHSGAGESGCVLVRPDQHVAWRQRSGSADPVGALREALATLGLQGAPASIV